MTPSQEKLTPDFSDGIDRKLLKKVRDRFLLVNQGRLERTKAALPIRHQDLLEILPLLYQVNHPLLPGFVGHETPRGVAGYVPDKPVLTLAKGYSQTFRFQADRRHTPEIRALFIMGSSGTMAHSEASDIDLWLCHDEALTPAQLAQLADKASAIDRWAAEQGLELHTFLMDAKRFCAGQEISVLDAESSGSAQHFLLLDEFYRTAILLAGCYPLWWLIPPDLEGSYTEQVARLINQRFINAAESIDFGSPAHIPLSELLSACLWQLYKSLDAPYKSVLKLLLSEVYAQELPHKEVLSLEFKRAVYDGRLDIDALDPYLMIYQRLENYLLERGESKRLDLVRKSFYLKVNKKLTRQPKGRAASWQRMLLQSLVNGWAWPEKLLQTLDNRSEWKADQVMQERQELLAELTYCYRFVSGYARMNNIVTKMSGEDLTYLGRKLYATFQRKAGKIERINPGIAPNLWEDSLAILHGSHSPLNGAPDTWFLYRNLASPADAIYETPLKKSTNLVELLAWVYYNGLYSRATRLNFVPAQSGIRLQEVQGVLAAFEQAMPMPLPTLSPQAFKQVSRVDDLLMVVNLGVDPLEDMAELGGMVVTDRTDALDYSRARRNLVCTIDQVLLNSWQELSAHHFRMGETLIQNLHAFLQLCAEQAGHRPNVTVHCFCPTRAETIARRVRQLFNDVYQAFFEGGRVFSTRYVIEIEDRFYVLSRQDGQFRSTRFDSEEVLLEALSRPVDEYCRIRFDHHALPQQRLLREVLAHARPHQRQIYLARHSNGYDLFMVDEYGSVLIDRLAPEEETQVVAPMHQYLSTVLGRQSLAETLALDSMPPLQIYQVSERSSANVVLNGNADKEIVFKRYTRIPELEAHPVVVTANLDEQSLHTQMCYDLSFDRREFSHYEYGDRQCDALVHYLRSARDLSARVPVKIVDAFLPDSPHGATHMARFNALSYLALYLRLDQRLQAAAQKLGARP